MNLTHEVIEAEMNKLIDEYEFPLVVLEDVNNRLRDNSSVAYAAKQLQYLKNNIAYGMAKKKVK